MISFLLCFTCEEVVFWIFDSFLHELYSEEIYAENSDFCNQEVSLIISLSKTFKILDEENEGYVIGLLKTHLKTCFQTIFLNFFNFQTVYFIWDHTFSKGSVKLWLYCSTFLVLKLLELEKVFLALIKINLPHLKKLQNLSITESETLIMHNTNFNLFRNEFSFELNDELRQKFRGFAFKKKEVNMVQSSQLLKGKQMTFYEEPNELKVLRGSSFLYYFPWHAKE